MQKYNHQKIEKKWQKEWTRKKIYQVKDKAKGPGRAGPGRAGKKNKMLLTEFPYPSGNLHIGHWYAFAVPDILARYFRMRGENVMYPIGFDAFGLPAENAAIQRKINPRDWTEKNIKYMTGQLESMGASFDWSRKISTIDPEYYKWTQWIFLQMYKKGLAYRAKTPANWCPSCRTVLANEQVIDGKCERCDSQVVQKNLEQWMFKITDYADRLIDDIERLDWPESTKLAQKNWIGRSEGATIKFKVNPPVGGLKLKVEDKNLKFDEKLVTLVLLGEKYITYRLNDKGFKVGDVCEFLNSQTGEKFALARIIKVEKKKMKDISEMQEGHEKYKNRKEFYKTYEGYYKMKVGDDTDIWLYYFELIPENIEVFTTRPDTIFGATYAVLAPEHKIISNLKSQISNLKEAGEYIIQSSKKTDLERQENKEKTGVELKGVKAINPANGKEVPIWISDYVLAGYGTGAVMAVPAHDQRDFDFAKKFNLPIEMVVCPMYPKPECPILDKAYEGEGKLVGSGQFDGMESEKARREIVDWLEKQGQAKRQKNYRLRDWVLSRQRYWGVPIPLIFCDNCKKLAENSKLKTQNSKLQFKIKNLKSQIQFSKKELENPGWIAVPEKDLPVKLPPLKDFLPADDGRSPLAKAKKWVSVKCPKCKGKAERETDTMDTFVDSSWYFIRYADPKNKKKFADAGKMKNWLPVPMYIGGAEHNTMHLLYSRFFTKVLYDLKLVNFKEPFVGRRNHGIILGPDGQKMSKSKGNVVDPDKEVKKYGADCVRMYLAFMGPYEQGGPWNPTGILGIKRFIDRVWNLELKVKSLKLKEQSENKDLEKLLHKTIKKVTEDIENFRFNTAISSLMIFLNEAEKNIQQINNSTIQQFLKLLAPFAPHLSEEIWQTLKTKNEPVRSGKRKAKSKFQSIHQEMWLKYDPKLIKEDSYKLIVQINGKMREVVDMSIGSSEEEIKKIILLMDSVKKWIDGKEIKKIIFVKDRLINFIV